MGVIADGLDNQIDDNLRVTMTPGHAGGTDDMTMIVDNEETWGKVALVGDLFADSQGIYTAVSASS